MMTRSTDWTTLPDDWRVAGTATSKATITNGCARIETHRARSFIEEMLPKVAQLTAFGRLAFVQTPHFAGTIERQRVRSSLRLCSGLLAEDVGSGPHRAGMAPALFDLRVIVSSAFSMYSVEGGWSMLKRCCQRPVIPPSLSACPTL